MRAGDELAGCAVGGAEMIRQAGFALDYFEVRHAETLAPVTSRGGRTAAPARRRQARHARG